MKKLILLVIIYVTLTAVIVPTIITMLWKKPKQTSPKPDENVVDLIDAELVEADAQNIDEFEKYILGVVAGEMPALFPKEALKAQAVAARTYAVRKMDETGKTDVPYGIGQAYIDETERKKRWGEHFLEYEKIMADAVLETRGEIMVYKDEPILAVFHAQSGGKTEVAENVWSSPLPYLLSVESSMDENAPDFLTEKSINCEDVVKALKNEQNTNLTAANAAKSIKILSRSEAGYVMEVDVAGRKMTGREIREALGLRSANFTFTSNGDNLVFTTRGYGHGAGMSQYGAKFMADKGENYKNILNHYYANISFSKYDFKY